MLNDQRIHALLKRLKEDHNYLITTAKTYEELVQTESLARARILHNHPFEGRNAEARGYEVEVVLADSSEMQVCTSNRQLVEVNLAEARANLEITQTATALWKALAYQASGGMVK